MLDHGSLSRPVPLVEDGDLKADVQRMTLAWGSDTVRVTKVKEHASEADVELGRVRAEDRLGNIEAGTAADLGGSRQSQAVMDVRRALVNAGELWYTIMQHVHRFMIALSRVSVNHDGRDCSAPDPLVWDQESRIEQRGVDIRVSVDGATLPGPPGFLDGPWVQVKCGPVTESDVAAWPYSVSLLCEFSSFLSSRSNLEVLILFEQWAGHR